MHILNSNTTEFHFAELVRALNDSTVTSPSIALAVSSIANSLFNENTFGFPSRGHFNTIALDAPDLLLQMYLNTFMNVNFQCFLFFNGGHHTYL